MSGNIKQFLFVSSCLRIFNNFSSVNNFFLARTIILKLPFLFRLNGIIIEVSQWLQTVTIYQIIWLYILQGYQGFTFSSSNHITSIWNLSAKYSVSNSQTISYLSTY